VVIKHQEERRQKITQAADSSDTDNIDQNLRPRLMMEYVGQQKVKEHLQIHMGAAKTRKEPLGHTLLHGPPGLGKTTLAFIIAREMGSNVRVTSGPAVEKPGDVASLLTNLQKGDILFIDEIHRLRPQIEEVLYSAMEDCVLDIMIGKGPTARSVRLNLQPFTLVGATTKAGSISAPLRDRFLHTFKLGFYEVEDMQQILELIIDDCASLALARASRSTPRIANRLVRAVRDFAQMEGSRSVSEQCVTKTLISLDIDPDGFDYTDRKILRTIIEDFNGGPVGLSNLSAILAEEGETIEDVYEPYLIQTGLIQRTPKGRIASPKAYEKLGYPIPESAQMNAF
jgi:holliday junction DNA helicase RuvB